MPKMVNPDKKIWPNYRSADFISVQSATALLDNAVALQNRLYTIFSTATRSFRGVLVFLASIYLIALLAHQIGPF